KQSRKSAHSLYEIETGAVIDYLTLARKLMHGTRLLLKNVLRLKLSNEHGLIDEAVIALFPEGDMALNTQDSKQMMYNGTNYSFIYSLVEDTKTVINVLPEYLDNYQQALGVNAKSGEHKLRIDGIDQLIGAYEIVLEDKLKETTVPMTNSTVYEFYAAEGEDHNRFVLHFNIAPITEVPTDIDNVEENIASIYIQDGSLLKVSSDWDVQEKTITVYTMSGSMVLSDAYFGNEYTKDLNVNAGVYIVKVNGGNYAYQQKVFIK
ncbi:MAG: T9SS type A sorting domain-containing protein, partial [Bacteroidales bacterium]|nr:T9SS type A sorting domain-containing protein [Bacteroidales bacterium]